MTAQPKDLRRARLRRVSLATGVGALALVAASLGYFAEALRTQTVERLEGDLTSSSYFLSDHAGRLFEVAALAFQRTEAAVSGRTWDSVASDQKLQRQVSGIKDALPYLERIWLTDPEGRVRLTTQSFPAPEFPAPREVPPPAGDRALYVGPALPDMPDGQDSFTISRRLDNAPGAAGGSVSAAVQASYFYDYWSRLNLPPGTKVTLYRQGDGRILAQYPKPEPGKGYSFLPDSALAPLKDVEGHFDVVMTGGERRVGAFHRVGDLPLAVRLTIPGRTVDAVWLDRARPYLIFALFAIVGLALVGYMAFRFLVSEARDRSTLEAEVRRRTLDLATLNALGRSLATQHSPDAVARAVVEAGRSLTGAVEGCLVPTGSPVPGDPDWLVAPVEARGGGLHGHLAFRCSREVPPDERGRAVVESLASQAAASLDNAALHAAADGEIEARKRTETQQQWLIRELHHRVKNTLATVQAVMGGTVRASGSMEDFQNAFTQRLSSLANTHSLLTEALWQKAQLGALLSKELSPYDVPQGRVRLEGPVVDLPSDMAVPLGMAVHEMATNAAKYGSLSVPDGVVSIDWALDDNRLRLSWREDGGPPPRREGVRPGFGSKLIDRVLRIQLQAEVSMERPDTGTRMTAVIPMQEEEPRRVPVS